MEDRPQEMGAVSLAASWLESGSELAAEIVDENPKNHSFMTRTLESTSTVGNGVAAEPAPLLELSKATQSRVNNMLTERTAGKETPAPTLTRAS
jgi:hypothetical protein